MRRRDLLRGAAASTGFWALGGVASAARRSPNETLDVAVVGVGGRGAKNLQGVAGENVVALCDLDAGSLDAASKKHPAAKRYVDYRPMMDDAKAFDAVVVSTPDHHHAFATMAALRSGKHVYCEKPLTHSLHEARVVRETALASGLATQMGTQIHAGDNYRRVVELVMTGAVGDVREVHVWVGGAWWAGDRPKETPPVPGGLDWDFWLGPAPERPYHPGYHPFGWRRWWDFGGGHLADMGCHYIDLPTWALKLTAPVACEAEGPPVHAEGAPKWLKVTWDFPRRGDLPPVKLTWYHGGRKPEILDPRFHKKWGSGVLFVGSKGTLLANYGSHVLLPEENFADFEPPAPFIPKSIGHHAEWIRACKEGTPTTCNFGYAGMLTETVLLGNLAYRSGKRVEWDAAALRTRNGADALIRRAYREGWSL